MGQGASRSRNGTCGVPLGQDPRHFALTKVHGVPNDIKYLSLYPGYTKKKACEDVEAWRAKGEPVHRVTKFHKMLRGDLVDDPRTYVFKKIYKLSAAEIAEIGKDDFYTEDMAIKELDHQNKRRKGGQGRNMPRFRYDPSRSVRFTNVKRNFVYKKGRKGVVTGYAGYRPNAPNFVEKRPKNPKRKMSTRNIWAQAYAQGMANADARHALTRPTPGSFAASPVVSEATSIRPSAPPRPTLSTATTIRPSAPPQPLSRTTQPKLNILNFALKNKTSARVTRVTGTRI